MKRIFKILFIVFCAIIILLIVAYNIYAYQASLQYKKASPPKVTADNIKSLVIALIQREELFVGYIDVKYIHLDRNPDLTEAEITMRNNAIADDSFNSIEYKVLAEKKGQEWTIVEYKSHWKCRGYPFLNFWTTEACS